MLGLESESARSGSWHHRATDVWSGRPSADILSLDHVSVIRIQRNRHTQEIGLDRARWVEAPLMCLRSVKDMLRRQPGRDAAVTPRHGRASQALCSLPTANRGNGQVGNVSNRARYRQRRAASGPRCRSSGCADASKDIENSNKAGGAFGATRAARRRGPPGPGLLRPLPKPALPTRGGRQSPPFIAGAGASGKLRPRTLAPTLANSTQTRGRPD
jgi:hypothetical protein